MDGPGVCLSLHEHEVGLVACAQEASAGDAVAQGGVVAHGADDIGDAETALVGQGEHVRQRVGQGGDAGCGTQGAALFVGWGVGGMVGGDGVDEAVADGAAQGFAVGGALDGGVALDGGAERGVVGIGIEEVGYAGFGGDVLGFDGAAAEEAQLAGGADVEDVDVGAGLFGQPDGPRGGAVAGFLATDERVVAEGKVGRLKIAD